MSQIRYRLLGTIFLILSVLVTTKPVNSGAENEFIYLTERTEYYDTVEGERYKIKGRYGMQDMIGKRSDGLGYFDVGTKLEVLGRSRDKKGKMYLRVKHPEKPGISVWIRKAFSMSTTDPRAYFKLVVGTRILNGYLLFENSEYSSGTLDYVQFKEEAIGKITLKMKKIKEIIIQNGKLTIIVETSKGKQEQYMGKFIGYRDELLFISRHLKINLNQKERSYKLNRIR